MLSRFVQHVVKEFKSQHPLSTKNTNYKRIYLTHNTPFKICNFSTEVKEGWFRTKEERIGFLQELEQLYGIKSIEEWYHMPAEKFTPEFLTAIDGFIINALKEYKPDVKWDLWKFKSLPSKFYKNPATQREYLDWLGKKLGFTTFDDWYNVKLKDFKSGIGREILHVTGFTPIVLLRKVYHEHHWKTYKFQNMQTNDLWDDPLDLLEFLEEMGRQLGIKTLDDWYNIETKDFHTFSNSAKILLNLYGGPINLLMYVYPNRNWVAWKFKKIRFSKMPPGESDRSWIDFVENEYGISKPEDWYKVTIDQLMGLHASVVLKRPISHKSLINILSLKYPDMQWHVWKFAGKKSKWYWKDRQIVLSYLQYLKEQLGYEVMEDWYRIRIEDITKDNYSIDLLQLHDHSVIRILQYAYPDYYWKLWEFRNLDLDQVMDKVAIFNLINQFSLKFKITNPEFYQLVQEQLAIVGNKAKSNLFVVLATLFPDHDWKADGLHPPHITPKLLSSHLKYLFPKFEINEKAEFLLGDKLRIYLDIWIPEASLGILVSANRTLTPEALALAANSGIRIVNVPSDWNYTRSELASLINAKVPGIIHPALYGHFVTRNKFS